jgi:hypothetical protein
LHGCRSSILHLIVLYSLVANLRLEYPLASQTPIY